MTGLKFELDIDAEIQKLGLPPAKPANSANRSEGVSNFSKISNYKAIISNKSEGENYQDILGNNTDRTDKTLDSLSYESGWEKCFPVKGRPFWRKDGIEVPL